MDPEALVTPLTRPSTVDGLRAMAGNLKCIVEGAEDRHEATLTFGGQTPDTANPTTTVSITVDDLGAILAGKEEPQAAFFAGKIRLDGDMALAMGLMTLAMAG